MKFAKKITLVICLCMFLLTTGVYASWTYTKAIDDISDVDYTTDMSLSDIKWNIIPKGELSVTSQNLCITLDEDLKTPHKAILKANGSLTVTFTGYDDDCEETQRVEKVKMKCKITSNNLIYKGKEVFKFKELTSGCAVDVWQIELCDLISLNDDLYLPTPTSYYELDKLLKNFVITFNFSVIEE